MERMPWLERLTEDQMNQLYVVDPHALDEMRDALGLYIETDECVCTTEACPPGCKQCMYCIANTALRTLEDGMFTPKFSPGEVVVTPGALEAFHNSGDRIVPYLLRHVRGDWGEVCAEDARENEFSLKHGLRLWSSYTLSDGTKIIVITEADRSSTCFLTPEEY